MNVSNHDGTCIRGDDNVEERLAELEIRRNLLISAMSKYQDAQRSVLFQVLKNNYEGEDNSSPPSFDRFTSATADANASEMTTRRPVHQEPFDDNSFCSRESSIPMISNDTSSDDSPSYEATSTCNDNTGGKAMYVTRKTQLISSLYRRQSISSDTSQAIFEKDAAFFSTVAGNELPREKISSLNARPVLAALLAERQDHKSRTANCAVNKNERYEAKTKMSESPSLEEDTEHDKSFTQNRVVHNENAAPSSDLPCFDDIKIRDSGFPTLGEAKNSRRISVDQEQSETTEGRIESRKHYSPRKHTGGNVLAQIGNTNAPVNISNSSDRLAVSPQKYGTGTLGSVDQEQPETTEGRIEFKKHYSPRKHTGGYVLAQIGNTNAPVNVSNSSDRLVVSSGKYGTGKPGSRIAEEQYLGATSYQEDSSDLLDLEASVENTATHEYIDEISILENNDATIPASVQGDESKVVNDDDDADADADAENENDDFNKALERKLDMMILGNPLWQKALQNENETSLEGEVSVKPIMADANKKTMPAVKTVSSATTLETGPSMIHDIRNNGMEGKCEEPIYLDSTQWANARLDCNLETPLASNVRKHDQFDFGVTSDLSGNSSDLESASSASLSSKEDRGENDSRYNDEDCDDYCSDDSSEKPPVPIEVHTITTDFTIQSIAVSSTLQTNIESLGDESLVRTNAHYDMKGARRRNVEENRDGMNGADVQNALTTKLAESLYSKGLKKFFTNPSILCQCTGPVAVSNVSSPSHGIFSEKGLVNKQIR
eukprot:jgi/Psemu1/66301/estExt_Genemark1.C_1930026